MMKFDCLVFIEFSDVSMANCMKIFMGKFSPVNRDIEPGDMDNKRLLYKLRTKQREGKKKAERGG